ncbi:class I SAM-dependent methyltransferase [Rhizobium sp. AN80A]|uniref:SAM-dependent methyltransferase n=1 Tax=Rhizobium sp. AN80A TaxID=3040673 RepID=UPI0024B37AF4|nr:class I SAM-dependent methyltransferase [Rhizobium sp. AN80A]
MPNDATTSFYAENAAVYATRDRELPTARLDAFLAALPVGAAILELGCGGGQDSAYMLSRGFDVTPTDGSPELASQAEALLGRRVEIIRFEQLDKDACYGGVWAEASLLHVERDLLPDVFARIRRALKPGGLFHATFKAGEDEGHDGFGRYYNYLSANTLSDLLVRSGWNDITISEHDGSGYDDKPTRWLAATAKR